MKIVLLSLIVIVAISTSDAKDCGGVFTDGHCYVLYGIEKGGVTPDEAEKLCNARSGYLAEFRSSDAYQDVRAYIIKEKVGTIILTGMRYNYMKNRNKAILRSGKMTDYRIDWFEGHPILSNKHGQMAMIAHSMKQFNGILNAEDGSRYSSYLCET